MRLVQYYTPKLGRRVGWVRDERVYDLTASQPGWDYVYRIFQEARSADRTMEDHIQAKCGGELPSLDYAALWARSPGDPEGWLLPPVDHPDPGHCIIGGTGLTHLGSTAQRDAMHQAALYQTSEQPKTDSQRMFEMGLEGGKPPAGERGISPECFFKGSAAILRGHHDALDVPIDAMDCGEEPEIVGCYVIGDDGIPYRLGFAVGNEWADHAMERVNYLWLAPSKLQNCAVGPELITDQPFEDLHGVCRIYRGDTLLYDSDELLTGQKHMSHSLANLEDHHFKRDQARVLGDVHLYFFGTMKLSYGHRPVLEHGDRIEIAFDGMGAPLANTVRRPVGSATPLTVRKG